MNGQRFLINGIRIIKSEKLQSVLQSGAIIGCFIQLKGYLIEQHLF